MITRALHLPTGAPCVVLDHFLTHGDYGDPMVSVRFDGKKRGAFPSCEVVIVAWEDVPPSRGFMQWQDRWTKKGKAA